MDAEEFGKRVKDIAEMWGRGRITGDEALVRISEGLEATTFSNKDFAKHPAVSWLFQKGTPSEPPGHYWMAAQGACPECGAKLWTQSCHTDCDEWNDHVVGCANGKDNKCTECGWTMRSSDVYELVEAVKRGEAAERPKKEAT
jgi:hypothetical protein